MAAGVRVARGVDGGGAAVGIADRDRVQGDVAVVGDLDRVVDLVAGVGPARGGHGRVFECSGLGGGDLHSFPTRRSSDLIVADGGVGRALGVAGGGVVDLAGVDVGL